jgi:hypothetical protein
MQLHFLMLPPCDCIAQIANICVWGVQHLRIKCLILGGLTIQFFQMGKRAVRCGSKMDESKVGVNQKKCHTHIKNFLTIVHTNAPPIKTVSCCEELGRAE